MNQQRAWEFHVACNDLALERRAQGLPAMERMLFELAAYWWRIYQTFIP